MNEFSAANLRNWDNRAELHSSETTGSYRIAKVLAGGSSLQALEAGEIGDIVVRPLVETDTGQYRALRVELLRGSPQILRCEHLGRGSVVQ